MSDTTTLIQRISEGNVQARDALYTSRACRAESPAPRR
jgi:hypothetical protein